MPPTSWDSQVAHPASGDWPLSPFLPWRPPGPLQPSPQLLPHDSFPALSPWSPQIGQWHVANGLSMDSRLYASNISDSLFNTTLVVTTILVSGAPRASQLRLPRAPPPAPGAHGLPREQKIRALITARPIYDSIIKLKLLFHMEMMFDEFQSSWEEGWGGETPQSVAASSRDTPTAQAAVRGQGEGHLMTRREKLSWALDPAHQGDPYSFPIAYLLGAHVQNAPPGDTQIVMGCHGLFLNFQMVKRKFSIHRARDSLLFI